MVKMATIEQLRKRIGSAGPRLLGFNEAHAPRQARATQIRTRKALGMVAGGAQAGHLGSAGTARTPRGRIDVPLVNVDH